jgi:hypothetical protein
MFHLYDDFDFSVLDSSEFKEDAVREDLIAPLLRRLGYLASGLNRVQRSKTLVHPFVMIGSKKNPVNIVPDYTLYVQDHPMMVIEAKGPKESIFNSYHVEQAYSYAIHPEIRVHFYALCNGRELIVYSINQWDPVLRVSLQEIDKNWHLVQEALLPRFLLNPELKNFIPDYGLAMLKSGVKPGTTQIIICPHHIQSIMKAEDDLYVLNTTTRVGDIEYLVTLDMLASHYNELLSLLPMHVANSISTAMKRAPFQMQLGGKVLLTCAGQLSEVIEGAYEEFASIIVSEINNVAYDPSVTLLPYKPRKVV